MSVYLDIIWLLNFSFDSLLLYLTALILKRDIRIWRICIGGLIGSIIILFSVTPYHAVFSHPLMKLLFSVLMVLMVFGYKRIKYFLTGLMTFYLTTFLVGGSLIGVHYFIKFDTDLATSVFLSNVQGFGDPISWVFVVIGFPLAWHFSRKNFERIEVTKIQYDQLVEVEMVLDGNVYSFKGLVDSGNQLYDPITKWPVMFVSINRIVDQLSEELKMIAIEGEAVIMGEKSISAEWANKIKVIPYKVMGQEHQLIVAIQPDKMMIKQNNEIKKIEKGLVSLTTQQLSSDEAFQCIVHPKMLIDGKSMGFNQNSDHSIEMMV